MMDKCRISWGRILGADDRGNLRVEYEPVVRNEGKLSLGKPVETTITSEVQGRSFVSEAKVGDWVSFHWGFACTVLTPVQVANLRKYTLSDMSLANMVPVPQ
jgi:hydrogenase maturation factor